MIVIIIIIIIDVIITIITVIEPYSNFFGGKPTKIHGMQVADE